MAAAAVLVATLAGSGTAATAAGSADEPAAETTPLSVALTSMSPAQIPRKGALTLTGVVANSSEESWEDVNVAPFVSSTPITTRDELAVAAATDPDVSIGERLTDVGTYASLGDLGPGNSAPFTIRVPVTSLGISGDPGVYWIGVHALGTSSEGRDLVADGRVRTFIPLVTPAAARSTAAVSLVLPLRARARRAEDGSLNGPARWAGLTAPGGRLTRVVDFGASAGAAAVSWIVDPAVLDALEDYGQGNPPLSLGSTRRADEPDDDASDRPGKQAGDQSDKRSGATGNSKSPSPSPSSSASATPEREGAPSELERARATSVLQTFLAAARGHGLLTLGYADPDVVSLARRRPNLIRRANELSARRMTDRELTGRPVVAPPEGIFDPDLLGAVPEDSVMVLTDRGQLQSPVLSTLPTGQELLLGDERAAAGGPSPTAADDPLALRQRILSEAALEVSKGAEPPRRILVVVPSRWDPGASWRKADFFGGIAAVPWARLVPLPRNPTTTYDGQLSYSPAQQEEEIGDGNIAATRTLIRTSTVLEQLLANNNDVDVLLTGAALQASAYSARPARRRAAQQVMALDMTTRSQMGRVKVTGTDFVTLSGGSGSLTVTLVNGLKQPITVGLRARTDSPVVQVEAPAPVDMQPGERTTLRLQVTSGVGVHEVRLQPVTAEGAEIGTPFTFSLRTSQVGRLIWYIIIAGAALLTVMIVRRIALRVRNHRWREGVGQ